jgi:hypothetical protein
MMSYRDSTKKLVKVANAMIKKTEKARLAEGKIKRLDRVLDQAENQETKGKINPEED